MDEISSRQPDEYVTGEKGSLLFPLLSLFLSNSLLPHAPAWFSPAATPYPPRIHPASLSSLFSKKIKIFSKDRVIIIVLSQVFCSSQSVFIVSNNKRRGKRNKQKEEKTQGKIRDIFLGKKQKFKLLLQLFWLRWPRFTFRLIMRFSFATVVVLLEISS